MLNQYNAEPVPILVVMVHAGNFGAAAAVYHHKRSRHVHAHAKTMPSKQLPDERVVDHDWPTGPKDRNVTHLVQPRRIPSGLDVLEANGDGVWTEQL